MRVYHGHPETFEKNLVDTSETILEEVDRLKTLADEFSNFARMPKPILVPNDICDILKSSVALFDKPEIGTSIVLDCTGKIPEAMVDRDALSRVFTNLIKNAVEAMEGRDGKIRVGAKYIMVGTTPVVRITIADEGVGMDEESLKRRMSGVFRRLSPKEREVIRLRFGLKDGRGRSLQEVGRTFDVSRERVRQIEAKAFEKLRRPAQLRKLQGFLDEESPCEAVAH